MRVVVDTNVLMSGVFFGGVPGRILEAWRDGKLTLVVPPPVLEEYHRVGAVLAAQYQGVDLSPILALLTVHVDVVQPAALPEPLCDDPDDDTSSWVARLPAASGWLCRATRAFARCPGGRGSR